jgi:hypothetical protein
MYGIDPGQYRRYVVRPTLYRIGLWHPAAENLVVGTALQESHLKYIDQLDKADKPGPAFGLCQMEGPTHYDLHMNFLKYKPDLRKKVLQLATFFSGDLPDPAEMQFNLAYSAAMCRVHYYRVPYALPHPDDAEGLALYWKRWYNTRFGKGTVEQALPHFQFAVKDGA